MIPKKIISLFALFSYAEPDLGQYDEDRQLYDIWVREFCRQAPNKELRLWLEGQAAEIYKEQGLESFGRKETSANNSFDCIFSFKFGKMKQIRMEQGVFMIKYKRTKDFEVDQIKILFRSVEWFSGNFPEKVQIALSNSSRG